MLEVALLKWAQLCAVETIHLKASIFDFVAHWRLARRYGGKGSLDDLNAWKVVADREGWSLLLEAELKKVSRASLKPALPWCPERPLG